MAARRSRGTSRAKARSVGAKPETLLKERYQREEKARREQARFRSEVRVEAARRAGRLEESALPASVARLLERRARERRGGGEFPPAPSMHRFRQAQTPISGFDVPHEERRSYREPQPAPYWLPRREERVIEDARLVVLSDFGDSWVEEQESGKKVRAGAGKLETDGAFYSSAVFGFESSVQVTGRQLEIEAHVNASFGWLEAFSLAPYAISLVRADAWMDLSVDGEHYSTEQVPLLRGVSPPGGGGEVGMWQEDDAQASASHSFRTVLWPPSGGERLLSVTELIRFSAIRVGDPKRCGATATGTFTFDPLRVTTASGPPL